MNKSYFFFLLRMLYGLVIFSFLFGFGAGIISIQLGENLETFWGVFWGFPVTICISFFLPVTCLAFVRWVLQQKVKIALIVNFSLLMFLGLAIINAMSQPDEGIDINFIRYIWIVLGTLIFLLINEFSIRFFGTNVMVL